METMATEEAARSTHPGSTSAEIPEGQPDFVAFAPPHAPVTPKRRGAKVIVQTTPAASVGRLLLGFVLFSLPGISLLAPTVIPQMISAFKWSSQKVAVQAYFDALAKGDSAAAVAQGVSTPIDTSFINDATLRSALDYAPMTDITLQPHNGSALATYKLGGDTITATVELIETQDGWRVSSPTQTVTLDLHRAPVTLNGVSIADKDTLELLPGDYPLAAINDRVSVTNGDVMVTPSSGSTWAEVKLTDKAAKETKTAALTKLKQCVNQTTAKPEGCGFGISDAKFAHSTVKWQITKGADELKNEDFYLSSYDTVHNTDGTAVAWLDDLTLMATARDSAGVRHTFEVDLEGATGDITGSHIEVTFF
jgi:hypothetical protein